jgi:Zn-finger nucleic acid-binding protein
MTIEERMLPCPICHTIMTVEIREEVEVDLCAEHGMWLDQAELVKITEKRRHSDGEWVWADLFRGEEAPGVDHTRTLTCPVSGGLMKIEEYKGVYMDWSPGHGVWLDKGELSAILNNLRLDDTYLRGVALRLTEGKY